MPSSVRVNQSFSFRAFLVGLGGVVALYGALYLYVTFQSDRTMAELEKNLASQSVIIDGLHHDEQELVTRHVEPLQAQPLHAHDKVIDEPAVDHEEETQDITDLKQLMHGNEAPSKALVKAPIAGYYEETTDGLLPIKKASNQTPFQAYRRPAFVNRDKPAIAVVIIDYGLSEKISKQALALLPSSVSMSLNPYAEQPDKWQEKAREDGHEIWMQLPVQLENFPSYDPGPNAILTSVSLSYNEDRMAWVMGRTTGYAGISAFTDSALEKTASMFNDLMTSVFKRGVGFLELNSNGAPFIGEIAHSQKGPYARNTAHIKSFAADKKTLDSIEAHIKNHNATIISVYPNLKNITMLKSWLNKMDRQGIQIVPVSALAVK